MSQLNNRVVAVLAALVLMVSSSWLILLNGKLIKHGFPYPMIIAAMGQGFSAFASYMCCKVFKIVDANKHLPPDFFLTKALPVGLFMSLTLYLSNIAYLYLTVAFISMLKAIVPAITMLGLFLARLETPTKRLILSVSIIALGTLMTSVGEVNFNLLGLVIVVLAISADVTRLVMTQLLLVGLKFHPVEGLMHLAPACTILLLTGSIMFEFRRIWSTNALAVVVEQPMAFIGTAVLGFFVNWLNYVVIKLSSALTLKVLGPIKNAIVVFSGMILFHETVTPLQFVGYGISVAAFFWYNKIKMQQANGSKPAMPSYDARSPGSEKDRSAEKL